MSQDPGSSLNPRMSVGMSIREPLECLDVEGDHRTRVRELLNAVGLDPDAEQPQARRVLRRGAPARRRDRPRAGAAAAGAARGEQGVPIVLPHPDRCR